MLQKNENSSSSNLDMPYRAELKRPDLKGQFPCSVCGKIFCHSSSLSRHRMQAHFKSYTCTQCNQEIATNETLRSHMFRMHSISRMFMCRCCNWAFPDKTSLHIHMQSMLRNGSPGDVAVLARSSTEDGPGDSLPETTQSFLKDTLKNQMLNNPNNSISNGNGVGSIFPNMLKTDNLLHFMRKDGVPPMDLSTMSSNQWLSAWLANNPFASNIGLLNANKTNENTRQTHEESEEINMDDDDFEPLEIETTEEDLQEEERMRTESPAPVSPTGKSESSEEGKKEGSQKRKSTRPQQVTPSLIPTDFKMEQALKAALEEKERSTPAEPLSPTVSDSHSSGTSCNAGDHTESDHQSEKPCCNCEEYKTRLCVSEAKNRESAMKINNLEAKIMELQRNREAAMHHMIPMQSAPSLPQMMPITPMPFVQNPAAMKLLFHNLMQAQLNRQC